MINQSPTLIMAENDPTYSLGESQAQSEAHQWLNGFWPKTMGEVKAVKAVSVDKILSSSL